MNGKASLQISGVWAKIIGAVVTALLAAFKLPGPLNEIIQQIIDALLNNSAAAGLGAVSLGLLGNALYSAKQGIPEWQKEAIKHGAAHFCPKTGTFQWKDDSANVQ